MKRKRTPQKPTVVSFDESGFAEDVIYCQRRSSAGALGIAQFMPATAAGMGINPCDPMDALHGAVRLMLSHYSRYGRWDYALAAYNAGPGNVDRYGGVPPFAETQHYVAVVLGDVTTIPVAPSPTPSPAPEPTPPTRQVYQEANAAGPSQLVSPTAIRVTTAAVVALLLITR